MKLSVVQVLLLLITMGYAQIENRETWGYQVFLGSDVELICNSTEAGVEPGDSLEWKNPAMETIMANDKYQFSEHNGVANMKLSVMDVQNEDHGVYLCFITRNGVHVGKINRAINYYEPAYEHGIDQYRTHIMMGGIAGAVLFVFLVGMCILYKCRYLTEEERYFEKSAKQMRKVHLRDAGAGPLPSKYAPENGGQYNKAYSESTNL